MTSALEHSYYHTTPISHSEAPRQNDIDQMIDELESSFGWLRAAGCFSMVNAFITVISYFNCITND